MSILHEWHRSETSPRDYAMPPVGCVRDGWPGTSLKKCAEARKRGVKQSNATVKLKALLRAGML